MFVMTRAAVLTLSALNLLFAQEWTEPAILEKFLEQNPLLRESRARIALAEAETKGRSLYANPTLSISREGAGRTEFYQASQSLPLNGRLALIREAGAMQSKVLESEGAFAVWNARTLLRQSFYRLLAVQLRREVYGHSLRTLQEMIRILREREREGEGSRLDRLRAERESENLELETILLESQEAQERGALLGFLPAAASIDRVKGRLLPPVSPLDLSALLRRALASRPDLQAERQRAEQFRAEQRAAARLRYPEPILNAGLKRAELGLPTLNAGPVIGLSLAIPLFNQGKAEVARYQAEQERSAAKLDMATRRLQADLDAALRVVEIRQQAQEQFARQLNKSGAELLRISTLAYQEGEIGILQLLDAHRLDREARLRLLELQAAVRTAHLQLESLLGEDLPQ